MAYSDIILADNPIVYYRLDDTTGVTATDSSGNSNDGTYTTAPTWEEPGLISVGNSAKYTNTTDRLSTPNSLITAFPFTIEGWINISSFSSTVGFCNTHGDASNYRGINAYINTSALFSLTYGDGSGDGSGDRRTWRANGFTFQTNTTYHIALVVNGHEDAELYINGVEETLTYSSGTGSSTSLASGYPVEFGNPQDPSSAAIAKDYVDELAIYDYALPSANVVNHYHNGLTDKRYELEVLADSPLLYWPLDESAGPTAKDLVGSNTGTYGGSPAFSQSTPDGLSNGVWFDAATDNVTDTYSMSSVRTIEFWLYITNWNQSWGRILHWESDFYIARYSSTSNLNLGKSGSDWDSGYALNNNQWYHITVTRSGSTLYLYANGAYIGSRTGFTWGTSSTLVLGDSAGEDTWFKMSDFAIYDTQHTIEQIAKRYHAGHEDYYPHAVYADNPVAYWKLDETTGTTATDYVGSNDLTYTNTPTLGEPGLVSEGTSVYFNDANTEYAEANIADFRNSDTEGSVEFWFSSTNTGDQDCFFQSGDNGSFNQIYFQMRSGGYIAIGQYSGADHQYRTTASFNDGNPHHVVITSNGTAWKIYVDGVNQALTSVSGTNNGNWFGDTANRDRVCIGSMYRNGGRINNADATIDEVAVYDYELSEDKVKQHYVIGRGYNYDSYEGKVISDNPAYYWRLDEVSGNITDEINSTTATASGTSVYGLSSPIDSGTAIDMPSTAYFDTSGALLTSITDATFELWFKSTQTTGQADLLDCSSSTNYGFKITLNGDALGANTGVIGFGTHTASNYMGIETTTNSWNDGEWHHVVCTCDGSATLTFTDLSIYIDGIKQPTSNSSFGTGASTPFTTSYLRIGGIQYGGGSNVDATIDEVAVYEYELTSTQVQDHYIAGGGDIGETSEIPAASIAINTLVPQADDGASVGEQSDIPAGSIVISALAPTTVVTNESQVPAASIAITPIAPEWITTQTVHDVVLADSPHIDLTTKKIGTNIPGGDYGTDVLLGDIAPVVYLPLDETEAQSPTQVLDYSGNDYHFTCVGSIDHDSTPLRLGAVDSCEMTSTTSHVVKSGRTIDLYLSGTIEFWFILHDWLEQDTTLFVQSNSGGSTGELDIKVLYATGQVEVRVGGTLWAVTEENVVTEDNRDIPKHFAVTWDETNGCAIYIDGQQNGTTSAEFDARFFSGNWYLGRGETTGEITIGTFSDLALYGSRLPPEDIQRHHDNSVLPGVALPKSVLPIDTKFISVFDDSGSYDAYIDSLNPTLWWKHTDTSPVSSVTDYSGNAYHGTTSGTEGPNTYTANVPGYHFHPTYIHKTYGEESRATNTSFPATTNFGSGLSGGGSVSIWFDVRDNYYDSGQLSHQCTLFTVGDISIYWKGGSTSNLYLNDGTTETWLTNVTENLHHIVLIISASFYSWSFEVYKDGNSTAVASGSLDGGPASDFVAVGDVSAYPTVYVDFGASSFEIYDFELSTDQIRNIWAYGINPPVEVFQSDLTAASIAITDYDPGATSALDSTCSLDTTNSIPITTYTFTVDNVDLKESDIPTEQIDVTSLVPTAIYTDLNHNISQYFNQQNVRIEPTELEVTNGADKAYYNNLFNNLHDLYRYHLSDIPTEEEVSGTALTYNGTTGHIAQAGTIVAGSSSPSLNFSGGACLVDSRSVFDDSSNSINVTFWFRPTTDGGTTGAYNTDGQGLVCGNAASALSDFYVIWWNSQVHVKVGAETVVSTACTLNESHLVSVSYSSTGGLIVSVDGVEKSNTTLVAGTALTSHTSVVIGKKVPADSNGFQGYIQYLGIGSDFVESNTPADYQIRYHASLWDTGKYFDDSGFINRQSKHIYSRSNRFYNAHHYLPLDDSAAPLTDVASGLTPTLTGTPTYQANADIITFDSTVMLMPESSSVQIELDLPYETSFDDDHVETIFAGGWFKFEDVFQEAGTHAGQITLINVRNTHGAGDLEFKIVVDPADQEIRWLFQEIGGSSVSGATKANWRPGVWTYLGIGYHNNKLYSYYQGNLIDTSNNINITEGDHNWKEVLYQNYGESDGGASWRRYRTKAAHLSVSYELPTTEQLSEIYDSVYTQEGLDYEVVGKLQANYDLFPLQEGQATGLVNSGYGDQRKLGSFTGTPTFTNAGPIYGMTDHAVTLATASAEAFVMEDEQDSTWSTSLVQFMIKIDSWTGTGECDIVRMDGGTNGYQLVLKRVASQNQVYLTDEAGNTSPAVDITLGQWMFLAVGCMPDPSTYHYILWINGGRKATTTTAPTQESFPTYTIGDTVGGANGWNGDISLVGTTHPLNWDQNHYEDYVYIQRTNRYWEELVDDWWENIFPLNTTTSTPDFLIKQGTASFVGTYTVDYEDGPMGDGDRAVRFHGANSYLQIDVSPDDQDFYCFAAWMKFNQLDDTNQWLITNGHSAIRMYVTDTNEIEGFPVVNNQWYHVVFQQYYDGAQWVQTWIDGVLVDTKSLGAYGGGATQIRFGSIGSGTNTDVSVSWASARDDKFDWNTDVPNITALYEAAINPTGFALPESLDNETVVHTAEIIPFPETQQWTEQPPEGVDLPASVIALTEQTNTWDTTENHLISMSLQSIDLTTLTPTATGSDVTISALDVAAVTFGSLNPGTTKTEHRWTNMTAAPIVLSEQSQTWTSLNYMQSDLGVNNIPFSELAPGTTYTEHNLVGINYLEIEITPLDQRLNRTENNWSELSAPAIEVLAQAPEADYSANRWSDVNALNIQITEQNQEFNTTEHHQILLDEKNIPILHPRMDATVSRDTDGREVFCYTLSVGSYSPMTSYIEQSRSYTLHIGTKMSEDLEIARRDEFMASVGRKWRIQDN